MWKPDGPRLNKYEQGTVIFKIEAPIRSSSRATVTATATIVGWTIPGVCHRAEPVDVTRVATVATASQLHPACALALWSRSPHSLSTHAPAGRLHMTSRYRVRTPGTTSPPLRDEHHEVACQVRCT